MKSEGNSSRPRLGGNGKRAERNSVSLAAFAGAHKQKYDKLHKLEKQRNLNAKKVNQYKKLKSRLAPGDGYAARVMEEADELDPLADFHQPPKRQPAADQGPQRRQQPGASSRPRTPSRAADGGDDGDDDDAPARGGGADAGQGRKKKKKSFNALEALAKKEEEARREREAERARVAAERAERNIAKERAEAERRKHAALMRKRNAKGQPVMRYRMEGILEKLMKEQQGKK